MVNPAESTTEASVLDLFPPGTVLNAPGEVMIGGCAASDLAAAFGTPAMIIDEAALPVDSNNASLLLVRWP
jgi:diaminopimelate decarboxylase